MRLASNLELAVMLGCFPVIALALEVMLVSAVEILESFVCTLVVSEFKFEVSELMFDVCVGTGLIAPISVAPNFLGRACLGTRAANRADPSCNDFLTKPT